MMCIVCVVILLAHRESVMLLDWRTSGSHAVGPPFQKRQFVGHGVRLKGVRRSRSMRGKYKARKQAPMKGVLAGLNLEQLPSKEKAVLRRKERRGEGVPQGKS